MLKFAGSIFMVLCACSLSVFGGDALDGLPKLIVGSTTHLPDHNKGIVKSNMQVFKDGGMLSPRDEISWRVCEQKKGVIKIPQRFLDYLDECKKQGLEPLTILDYYNPFYDDSGYPHTPEGIEGFARYCEAIVKASKGKCRIFQVWNEWDGGCGMPTRYKKTATVEGYMKLIKVIYPRIKKIAPDSVVMSTSVCPGNYKFFEKLVEAGVIKHCDALAFHTYIYPTGTPEEWLEWMQRAQAMIRRNNGGIDYPLFITEMGWPTQLDKRGVSPEISAMYLSRLYLLARTLPFIRGVWWYDFQDDGWNAEHNENNFGLVKADLTPKDPYYAMQSISGVVGDSELVKRIPAKDKDIWLLQFKYKDGRDAMAMWSAHYDDDWQVCLRKKNAGNKMLKVYHAGRSSVALPWGARAWADAKGAVNRGKVPLRPNELEFCLRGLPLIAEGDLSNIELVSVKKRERGQRKFFENPARMPDTFAIANNISSGNVDTYPVEDFGSWRHGKLEGKEDLDAKFSAAHDGKNIYLKIDVTDDKFFQDNASAEYAWQADGIQMAFQYPDEGGSPEARTEIDVALTVTGPQAYVRKMQKGELKQFVKPSDVKVEQDGTKTVYRIRIPWTQAGFPELQKGKLLKFSFLINDNDGDGRKGYLHWGAGIGDSKDPEQYNLLLLN